MCEYQIALHLVHLVHLVQGMWVSTGHLVMLLVSGSSLCGQADTSASLQIIRPGLLFVTLVPFMIFKQTPDTCWPLSVVSGFSEWQGRL